jgi:nucleotide-binding universal stress UspA family protein
VSVVAVGVDGSAGSERALRWAASYARATGARLRAVRAWSYLDQPAERFDPAWGEDEARRGLDDALAALGDELAGVEVERLVVCDLAAPALLDAAKDADLVVVGSRGIGGFEGLRLGSVSSQVAHHAACPVVVVPGEERAPS